MPHTKAPTRRFRPNRLSAKNNIKSKAAKTIQKVWRKAVKKRKAKRLLTNAQRSRAQVNRQAALRKLKVYKANKWVKDTGIILDKMKAKREQGLLRAAKNKQTALKRLRESRSMKFNKKGSVSRSKRYGENNSTISKYFLPIGILKAQMFQTPTHYGTYIRSTNPKTSLEPEPKPKYTTRKFSNTKAKAARKLSFASSSSSNGKRPSKTGNSSAAYKMAMDQRAKRTAKIAKLRKREDILRRNAILNKAASTIQRNFKHSKKRNAYGGWGNNNNAIMRYIPQASGPIARAAQAANERKRFNDQVYEGFAQTGRRVINEGGQAQTIVPKNYWTNNPFKRSRIGPTNYASPAMNRNAADVMLPPTQLYEHDEF